MNKEAAQVKIGDLILVEANPDCGIPKDFETIVCAIELQGPHGFDFHTTTVDGASEVLSYLADEMLEVVATNVQISGYDTSIED